MDALGPGRPRTASPNGRSREASGQSEDPEISADGRFVAFASFVRT
jgi:hypothetical protein